MPLQVLNGDQAMACGALISGVKMVTSYPGSPSSGTVEAFIHLAKKHKIYVEWSSNEKVAVEMAIGASIAGERALVCTKSVGMNVMLDPLMALNLTPVLGGLVILLGDDPGGYGSQNDQDTRSLAWMLEMPMMEPAGPSEAYEMMLEAFTLSEKLHTTVIIRETRSFTQEKELVHVADTIREQTRLEYKRESLRFVPVPKNVVEKHRGLHAQLKLLAEWADTMPFNRLSGHGAHGIAAAGFAFKKLMDVIGQNLGDTFRLLKLGVLHPLPEKITVEFLKNCSKVLVFEENEPYIETQLKAIAYDHNCQTVILGKQSNDVSREGELFRWQILEAIHHFMPDSIPAHVYLRENEQEERPESRSCCSECRYDEVLDLMEEAASELKKDLVIVGDPGCLVTVAERLDAKYAIGSAVGVAGGMNKAGMPGRQAALIGDSGFFHSALPAICNAVHNQSDILIVVLDNEGTLTSGNQPHPGVGRNASGEKAPKLSIPEISKACGIEYVDSVCLDDPKSTLKRHFQDALRQRGPAMIAVKIPPRQPDRI